MGFLDTLLGNDAADASRKAAADTYAKQQAATSALTSYGDTLPGQYNTLAQGYQPWQQTGQVANDQVRNLIANPSSVRGLPGYQFGMDQGIRSLDHSALANGSFNSGKTGKALEGFATNYADKTYGDQLARLLGVSQQGLGATQAGINTQGQGIQDQLGTRTSAYGGQMQSAGTIGQGDIAAANAKAKGMQGLLNFAGQLGGSALSFGAGGGGGGLSSLFGGGGGGLSGGGAFNNSNMNSSYYGPLN